MPSAAPRACHCGRIQPCPEHVRKRWDRKGQRASRHARGYGRLAQPVACERGRIAHETWDGLRACVLERDHAQCGYCGRDAATTVDHRTAKAEGGTNAEANLVACCSGCHRSKSGREGQAARARRAPKW